MDIEIPRTQRKRAEQTRKKSREKEALNKNWQSVNRVAVTLSLLVLLLAVVLQLKESAFLICVV